MAETLAITRGLSPAFDRCELTHLPRAQIDVDLAREQHRRYEQALSRLGCTLLRLPGDPDLPDSVFVEDTAVVLDELAILTRPGAPSRRGESDAVGAALTVYRPLARMTAPATMDGGDVLRVGRTLFAGLSGRTNRAGIDFLRDAAAPLGYRVRATGISGCLHLKSAVTGIAADAVLLNPERVDAGAFDGLRVVEVDPSEPDAANALLVCGTVLFPTAYPRTRDRLLASGVCVLGLDVTEIAKAEGALTCCSLLLDPGIPTS